jgi:hypothetical protein
MFSTWVERHVNVSMALGWLAVAAASFILLFPTQNESGSVLFSIYGSLSLLGLLIGAWGLKAKGRSLSWMVFFLIPFGFLVLFVLKNSRMNFGE